MSQFPSLPLYTDAFIADTGHLNATETGAYLMLLMVAWRSPDCALPDDDSRLCRWARVDPRSWARIKPRVMEFWTLTEGKWTQKRLLSERDKVSKRAEAARENGKHGGRPKSLKINDAANPAGSSRVTQKKASISISKDYSETMSLRNPPKARAHEWPADFEERIWKLYPKKTDRKKSVDRLRALYRADKIPFEVIVAGIERLCSHLRDPQYAPTLERWLRDERWTDQHPTSPPSVGNDLFGPPGDPHAIPHNRRTDQAPFRRPGPTGVDAVAAALAERKARRAQSMGGGDLGEREEHPDDSGIIDADWRDAGSA